MPGRTRGETRAMQDSHHSMGLMSISEHAWLANHSTNRETIDEVIREHGLPRTQFDFPTAPARSLSPPSTVAEVEASTHAEIWRGSRADELGGLLQAHNFTPAKQSIGNGVVAKC